MANPQALSVETSSRAAVGDASVVKSAGRALQILEYFDAVQREASVSEISRALHCPQSSTSVLLRSLVHLGYLQNDRYRRTYYPRSEEHTSGLQSRENLVCGLLLEKK